MDEEFKKEWVAALRSGKYEQTTGILTRINLDGTTSHCCLGVACEIAVEKGWLTPVDRIDARGYRSNDSNDTDYPDFSILPEAFLKVVGLKYADGVIGIPSMKGDLSLPTINDTGESFEHIADLIEYFG